MESPTSLPAARSAADLRRMWWCYALAPVLTAAALFLRLSAGDNHGPLLLIMQFPIVVVAFLGGFGPGVVATILSAGATAYFLLEPRYSFLLSDTAEQLDWVALILEGLLVSALSELFHRARRRTESVQKTLLARALLLNQTYDAVLMWEWNGPITFWNSAAEKLYGYGEQEAVGRVSHELLATGTPGALAQALADLEANGKWEGELSHMARDGRQLTVESRLLLVREPGRAFVVEANRDVTAAKAAEREILRTQQRFQTAFRLSPLGKLVVRLSDGVIVAANDAYAAMLGEHVAEIVGQRLMDHNPLVDSATMPETQRGLEQGTRTVDVEVQFRRKNGAIGSGVLYAEVLEGAPDPHALLVLNDVTKRQQAEDELRLANMDLQEFAYIAAHDLQEPARNVSTALGLFQRSYGSLLDADGAELIQESIDAAKRMHRMIRDLLTFTRTGHGVSREEARADGNGVLGQALENLKRHIAESDAEITAEDLPVLAVHPTHLLQLLQNLIGNAVKYRTAGVTPRIHIAAQQDGSIWSFSISDNGIGFDAAFSEQIFGVFKRLHHDLQYSGNGIGLAVCQRIVRLYGGRIWAKAEPGQGATFSFMLPAVRSGSTAAQATSV